MYMQENKLIPIAIIVAGLLVGGAVFLSSRGGSVTPSTTGTPEDIALPPVTAEDHILGNPNAQLMVVEYSDFECPFCKNFHQTMHRIIDEYGAEGRVAWVYRHFPIVQIHTKAPKEAEATECATELAGNNGFWAYADRLFEVTPSNNALDLDLLPQIAEDVGLDRAAFVACLDSDKYKNKVSEQARDAQAAGARGTPYSVIIARTGQLVPIDGAQPYENLKPVIDALLGETN